MKRLMLLAGAVSPFCSAALEAQCPTSLTIADENEFIRREEAGLYSVTNDGSIKTVALRFHIVRNSQGNFGANPAVVPTLLLSANTAFQGAGLQFVQKGTTQFIDSSVSQVIETGAEANALRSANATPTAIDVFLVDTLLPSVANPLGFNGLSSYSLQDPSAQGILLSSIGLPPTNPSTWQHELAHYFDVVHTWDALANDECPDGSNCASTGDFVCDTPAEPFPPATGTFFPNCSYQPGFPPPQACGQVYAPDGSNFMAFAPATCRTSFTPGQLARARAGYLNFRPELRAPCTQVLTGGELPGDLAGAEVAVSKIPGTNGRAIALVGAPEHDGRGTVFVYEKATLHGSWTSLGELLPPTVSPNGAQYGSSLAFDGRTALVGAPGNGNVHVFEWNAFTGFQHLHDLVDATSTEFGFDVAVHDEWALVGAPGASIDTGEVQVYRYLGGQPFEWVSQGTLPAPALGTGDRFGEALDLSATRAVVGAPNYDTSNFTDVGQAFTFELDPTGTNWSFGVALLNPQEGAGDLFGAAVSTWGNQVAIGAPNDENVGLVRTGQVHVFEFVDFTGSWNLADTTSDPTNNAGTRFGEAVAISSNELLVGAPFSAPFGTGAVYRFHRLLGTWLFLPIPAPAAYQQQDHFGSSLDLCEDLAVAGAPDADGTGTDSGSAVAFGIIDPDVDPQFLGNTQSISNSAGGTLELTLQAGPPFAGDTFLVMSNVTGSQPGFPYHPLRAPVLSGVFPHVAFVLPLNPDFWFNAFLSQPAINDWIGTFDQDGNATLTFDWAAGLNPFAVGARIHFCYVNASDGLFEPSEVVWVDIVP